ncbi:unnamed protein product [Cochlearia groenlandica]
MEEQGISLRPSIGYRSINPNDLNRLEQIHREIFPIKYEYEFFKRVVNGVGIISWAAFDRNMPPDHLIGFVTARFLLAKDTQIDDLIPYDSSTREDTLIYILTLGVVQSYRTHGIAKSLIDKVIKYASGLSLCRGVYLHVIAHNTPAIRLYNRLMFRCVRRLHGFYLIKGQHFDAFLFVYFVNGSRTPCSPLEVAMFVVNYVKSGMKWVASKLTKNEEKGLKWLFSKDKDCNKQNGESDNKSEKKNHKNGDSDKKSSDQKKDSSDKKNELCKEIVMKVYMHCQGCASQVSHCLKGFHGVEQIKTEIGENKVVVTGKFEDPVKILKRVQKKFSKNAVLISPKPNPNQDHNKKEPPQPPKKETTTPQIKTITLKMNMHCEGCVDDIKRGIEKIKGILTAEPDRSKSTVVVKGVIDEPPKLVEKIKKKLGKHAEILSQNTEKPKDKDNKEKDNNNNKNNNKDNYKKDNNNNNNKDKNKDSDGHMIFSYPPQYSHQHNYPSQLFSDENVHSCSIM